jgi:hypothetical protein
MGNVEMIRIVAGVCFAIVLLFLRSERESARVVHITRLSRTPISRA